jgi:2-methylisocitrate lyase-like PEP mutase family enzyme
MNRSELATRFRRLHDARPLVLPNAWDAASARVIELTGAPAIATTSAGVSWALGRGDGQRLTRDEMLEAVARIAVAVSVPVTADVESGYGEGTVEDVAETVRAVIEIGVVGINLEDSIGGELLPPERQAQRIETARDASGSDLFVNARVDVYLLGAGAPEGRLEETVRRAKAYRAAGADGVFVPGVVDRETIAALAGAVDAPLNVMAGPGAAPIRELARIGVARVSVGPAIAQAALEVTRRAARELLEQGTYGEMEAAMAFPEANGMFGRGARVPTMVRRRAASHSSSSSSEPVSGFPGS